MNQWILNPVIALLEGHSFSDGAGLVAFAVIDQGYLANLAEIEPIPDHRGMIVLENDFHVLDTLAG